MRITPVLSERKFFYVNDSVRYHFIIPGQARKIAQKLNIIGGEGIFWSKYEPKNFGDWIGPYLYVKITGREPFFQRTSRHFQTIFSVGSILRKISSPNSAIVWGSGIISQKDLFLPPKEIIAVRGKYTREHCLKLGIPCPEVYGDPGILLPKFFEPHGREKKYALGIIPHFRDFKICNTIFENYREDFRVIDVTRPIETVISEINRCEACISSSLHGLIISHSYGIPCGWVKFVDGNNSNIDGDDIKYFDYFSAFNEFYEPNYLALDSKGTLDFKSISVHIDRSALPDVTNISDRLMANCPYR